MTVERKGCGEAVALIAWVNSQLLHSVSYMNHPLKLISTEQKLWRWLWMDIDLVLKIVMIHWQIMQLDLFVVYLTTVSQWLRLYSVEWRGVNWMLNWKGCGRKRLWPNFKVLSQNLRGGTEKNHETPYNSRSPGWDLNPGPPEYESGVLTTRPRQLVKQSENNGLGLVCHCRKYHIQVLLLLLCCQTVFMELGLLTGPLFIPEMIYERICNGSGMILSGKSLSHCHFVHHKSHMEWPGCEPRNLWWELVTDHQRCGTAPHASLLKLVGKYCDNIMSRDIQGWFCNRVRKQGLGREVGEVLALLLKELVMIKGLSRRFWADLFFWKHRFRNAQRDLNLIENGEVQLYWYQKKGTESCSGLRPSEKELPQWRSGTTVPLVLGVRTRSTVKILLSVEQNL
jgi:hypothetical protein